MHVQVMHVQTSAQFPNKDIMGIARVTVVCKNVVAEKRNVFSLINQFPVI